MTEPPAPVGGPCEWPINTLAVPGWDDAEEEPKAAAETIAAYVLWALSGRRFGVCTVKLRPETSTFPARYCNTNGDVVFLPGPVAEVDEVLIDGVVFTGWKLYGNELVRADGWLWPAEQDLGLDDTEVGTWSVSYRQGIVVPLAGQYAAGVLAGEILKAMIGAACRLPSRAQSVSREGVNMELLDAATFLEGGRTGIPEVDLWLRVVNPHRLAAPPRVWSPDVGNLYVGGGG